MVTRFTLGGHRRDGIRVAIGVVAGLTVWGALTVVGLAALLAASSAAYTVALSRSTSVMDRPRVRVFMDRITGSVLVALGLRVAAEAR